jgi:DNA-directed RNA polymerase specialized sigma24 family protein
MDNHEQLLAGLRRRDDTVLAALVDQTGPRLAAVVRTTWRGVGDADLEEIVAVVIADAWFDAAKVDVERGSLVGWLVMRARFRTLDAIRSRRGEDQLLSKLARLWREPSTMPGYLGDVDAHLTSLSSSDRELAWWRFVEGRPVAEIARRRRATPKAIEHRLARLRGLRANSDP